MISFKSNRNIQKKEHGPDRSVSDNQSSSRLKLTHIQGGEKHINYLKSLEKQKAESKIISKLIVNGKTINGQNEILDEQRQYYKNFMKNEII